MESYFYIVSALRHYPKFAWETNVFTIQCSQVTRSASNSLRRQLSMSPVAGRGREFPTLSQGRSSLKSAPASHKARAMEHSNKPKVFRLLRIESPFRYLLITQIDN